jgi:hypothetical protein
MSRGRAQVFVFFFWSLGMIGKIGTVILTPKPPWGLRHSDRPAAL